MKYLILCFVLFSSCESKILLKDNTLERENYKYTFVKGWIKGANSVTNMVNDNTYSKDAIRNKLIADSLEFAKMIDDIFDK